MVVLNYTVNIVSHIVVEVLFIVERDLLLNSYSVL